MQTAKALGYIVAGFARVIVARKEAKCDTHCVLLSQAHLGLAFSVVAAITSPLY